MLSAAELCAFHFLRGLTNPLNQMPASQPKNHEPTLADDRLFEEAYKRHHSSVFRFLMHLTHDAHWAEDLLQEVWVRVYREFRSEHYNQPGMLWRRAHQLYQDERRYRKARPFLKLQDPEASPDLPAEKSAEIDDADLRQRFFAEYAEPDLAGC